MKQIAFIFLTFMLLATQVYGQRPRVALISYQGGTKYTKFGINARTNGVKLDIVNYDFKGSLTWDSELRGIIMVVTGDNDAESDYLVKLKRHVQGGGRAILFIVEAGGMKYGEFIADLFGIGVTADDEIYDKKYVPCDKYLPWFGKGTVGTGDYLSDNGMVSGLFSPVYLVPVDVQPSETVRIKSKSSGKDRIVAMLFKIGGGEMIMAAGQQIYHKGGFGTNNMFFSDFHYDKFDNEQIITEMLTWLVSK